MKAETLEPLVLAAWREKRVNASYSGMPLDACEVDPSLYFLHVECGYGQDEGPPLEKTCRGLWRRNVSALNALWPDGPIRFTYPKDRPGADPREELPESDESIADIVRRALARSSDVPTC